MMKDIVEIPPRETKDGYPLKPDLVTEYQKLAAHKTKLRGTCSTTGTETSRA
jgi:hypothetical protein